MQLTTPAAREVIPHTINKIVSVLLPNASTRCKLDLSTIFTSLCILTYEEEFGLSSRQTLYFGGPFSLSPFLPSYPQALGFETWWSDLRIRPAGGLPFRAAGRRHRHCKKELRHLGKKTIMGAELPHMAYKRISSVGQAFSCLFAEQRPRGYNCAA